MEVGPRVDNADNARVCIVCADDVVGGAAWRCPDAQNQDQHVVCHGCVANLVRYEGLRVGGELPQHMGGLVQCPGRIAGDNRCRETVPHAVVFEACAHDAQQQLHAGMNNDRRNEVLFDDYVRGLLEAGARLERDPRPGHGVVNAQEQGEEQGRAAIVQHIRERIMNLQCPRCHAVFADFDGCTALTCARCRCGFCGVCFADCGRDAHAHIQQLHPQQLWMDRAAWDRHVQEWRGQEIARFVAQVKSSTFGAFSGNTRSASRTFVSFFLCHVGRQHQVDEFVADHVMQHMSHWWGLARSQTIAVL